MPSCPMLAATRLLIVGCGDVGMRVLKLLQGRWPVLALTSNPERRAELRAAGARPLLGNLDEPASLGRLAGLADRVLHLAPPQPQGRDDLRTAALLQALARGRPPASLVYASTSGVYGDCGGARFDESRPVAPGTDRALRRVAAERRLRVFGAQFGSHISLLRVPGIYASDREGGHPRERLARGSPVLRREEDVYTNHIHADDLARACVAALFRGLPQRAVHVCDDSELRMGDYFDLAADLCGISRPPRVARAEAARLMSPMQLSFMSESRRLINTRLKTELRLKLRYPQPAQGLLA
ncbi:NAD-dependent epimerase/dehydratase family protein [Paucibacter sp. M5-1]|uniref:NAD-dependent epimerase/dehydratase family protein n=1 Tax=Paucibacter sp. M5-1 TaxID=3015998 RepID=UPI0022B918D2|nr:NAD-dependent epimerase/dehydratase family protein [Paucibacter sp. M5-1]MCZ7883511.1 NAD-dependent epimerase/dehydratase family protein [Paucibacter sp. M5-1]